MGGSGCVAVHGRCVATQACRSLTCGGGWGRRCLCLEGGVLDFGDEMEEFASFVAESAPEITSFRGRGVMGADRQGLPGRRG